MKSLESYVIAIPDYPKPGILFRDVTGILDSADGLRLAIDQLADRMGTDRNTVYRHEHGLCEMSACTLFQYAEALETTPGALSPARFRPEDGSGPDNSVASLLGRLSGESLDMIRQLAEHLLRQESKMQHI